MHKCPKTRDYMPSDFRQPTLADPRTACGMNTVFALFGLAIGAIAGLLAAFHAARRARFTPKRMDDAAIPYCSCVHCIRCTSACKW